MSSYSDLLAEHASLPEFTPFLPTSSLQPFALAFLTLAFVLSFYFTTLPTRGTPTKELAVGLTASMFGGFGLVFAFCAIGANV